MITVLSPMEAIRRNARNLEIMLRGNPLEWTWSRGKVICLTKPSSFMKF